MCNFCLLRPEWTAEAKLVPLQALPQGGRRYSVCVRVGERERERERERQRERQREREERDSRYLCNFCLLRPEWTAEAKLVPLQAPP